MRVSRLENPDYADTHGRLHGGYDEKSNRDVQRWIQPINGVVRGAEIPDQT